MSRAFLVCFENVAVVVLHFESCKCFEERMVVSLHCWHTAERRFGKSLNNKIPSTKTECSVHDWPKEHLVLTPLIHEISELLLHYTVRMLFWIKGFQEAAFFLEESLIISGATWWIMIYLQLSHRKQQMLPLGMAVGSSMFNPIQDLSKHCTNTKCITAASRLVLSTRGTENLQSGHQHSKNLLLLQVCVPIESRHLEGTFASAHLHNH